MTVAGSAVWVRAARVETAYANAWRPPSSYATYRLLQAIPAVRVRARESWGVPSLTPGKQRRNWFAVSPGSVPVDEFVREYAIFHPRIAAEAFGQGTVMEDTWLLQPGSVVNVGIVGPQHPFTTDRGMILLSGGAIQLELRSGPEPLLIGRRPVRGEPIQV